MSFPRYRRVLVAAALCYAATATAADGPPKPGENVYLAVGHGGQRMFSRDGMTWGDFQSWGEPKHDQNDLNVAVNFKGAFYAGGGFYSGRITATRDGKAWSDGVIPGSSPIFGFKIFGDTLYAVDLRGNVFKTEDGEKWPLVATAKMPTDKHWIRNAAQGNGLILASGDFGPAIAFDPKTGTVAVTQMEGQVDKNPGPKRVAFGNGAFVVIGQSGLIATTKDGKSWENNKTDAGRGDVQCVEFNGKEFLVATYDAKTKKSTSLRSADGKSWVPGNPQLPRQVRAVNGWLYSSNYAPSKVSRSKDGGETWEGVPNEKGWHFKAYAYGPLAGGPPPNVPPIPKKAAPKPPAK